MEPLVVESITISAPAISRHLHVPDEADLITCNARVSVESPRK